MEHLTPEGFVCHRRSAGFTDIDELARHKKSHEVSRSEDAVSCPDSPDTKESETDYENGIMDPPGPVRTASSARADAKREASPDQKPNPVKKG